MLTPYVNLDKLNAFSRDMMRFTTTRQSRLEALSVSILDLFCSVDAFWQEFEPLWERELVAAGRRQRQATRLSCSAIMTILIHFQQSGYRAFKGFSTQHVQVHVRAEFPHLVSYTRLVALMPRALLPLAIYLHTQLGQCTGISFVDATSLVVCHNARISDTP